jgi:hypothetical protein
MEGSGIQLDHEQLDVYQLARELARVGNTVVQQVPSGRADLIDQFRRTTLSNPLNIAEGGGEYAPREKARFYRIAKAIRHRLRRRDRPYGGYQPPPSR